MTTSSPSVDLGDNTNNTLYLASSHGNLALVEYIISNRLADKNYKDNSGRTPVMAAARNGHVAVFDFLVSQGCDLLAADVDNNTVIHQACKKGCLVIVRKLIEDHKCDINIRNNKGWTPLIYAVHRGHVNVFDFLVSQGSDPKAVHCHGKNILHLACLGGHVGMVDHIVSQHLVDIDSVGAHGKTALLYAVSYGFVDVVDFLRRNGCNMTVTDNQKLNVLHRACRSDNTDMVDYILKNNIVSKESRGVNGWTPLMIAARKGHLKVFDLLVRSGCKLMAIDNFGENVLHVACRYGKEDIVQLIISHDSFNMDMKEQSGKTAVMIAAESGRKKVVNILVNGGCDFKSVDHQGNNVLHIACIFRRIDIVKYLIKLRGIEKNRKNNDGRTPAEEARRRSYAEIVSLFN